MKLQLKYPHQTVADRLFQDIACSQWDINKLVPFNNETQTAMWAQYSAHDRVVTLNVRTMDILHRFLSRDAVLCWWGRGLRCMVIRFCYRRVKTQSENGPAIRSYRFVLISFRLDSNVRPLHKLVCKIWSIERIITAQSKSVFNFLTSLY